MRLFKTTLTAGTATLAATLASAVPAQAQEAQEERRTTVIQPYIEASQVLSAEITPGDEVLTYTQLAAGVDINTQARNAGASLSLRYERNISYDDNSLDTDTVSGIARGYIAIDDGINFEVGGLASQTRVDGGGAVSQNPQVAEDATSQIYSAYAAQTFGRQLGDVSLSGQTRIGYNRFETSDAVINGNGDPVDVFDDSVAYASQITVATRAGEALPVGLAVTGGAYQEDISNLDQRVRDINVRGDVTIPINDSFAFVGGVGYEDVEVSSRDAVRDANGDPIVGDDGRFVTDSSAPRVVAFDVDGLLWDVGVQWRPSSRTSLTARVGERYDSTTYYGDFTYVPDSRSSLYISVYDNVQGFGGALGNALSQISTDFTTIRNPISGGLGGLLNGDGENGTGGVSTVGSIRSSAFRNRGVAAGYQRQIGRMTAAFAAGYDRRTFIAAEGTALEGIDGLRDESYYINAALTSPIGRSGSLQTNAYASWFLSGDADSDVNAYGASAAYNRTIFGGLSARAAVGVDYIDSEFSDEDFATATALLGLRYDF